jgi:hypothetical protein
MDYSNGSNQQHRLRASQVYATTGASADTYRRRESAGLRLPFLVDEAGRKFLPADEAALQAEAVRANLDPDRMRALVRGVLEARERARALLEALIDGEVSS